jgi:sulfatase maturation enzyme AslB (radical SAM superfamily)
LAIFDSAKVITGKRESSYIAEWQTPRVRHLPLLRQNQKLNLQTLPTQQNQLPVMINSITYAAQNVSNNFADTKVDAGPSTSASTKKCASCSKVESDPEKPLKPCSKCQSVLYCSRDCQKADFKKHKKTCALSAQIYAQTADLKPTPPPRAPKKDAHRGGLQKWQFDT